MDAVSIGRPGGRLLRRQRRKLFTNGTRILIERPRHRDRCGQGGALHPVLGPESWALRRGEIEAGAFWAWIGPRLQAATGPMRR